MNYHYVDGAIYFWTGEGAKLTAAGTAKTVAFEVDDIDARYHQGWSVLAVGTAERVHDPERLEQARQFPLRPWAPGARDHLVRIAPDSVSGRRITFRSDR